MGPLKKQYGPVGHRLLGKNKDEYERFMSKNEKKGGIA